MPTNSSMRPEYRKSELFMDEAGLRFGALRIPVPRQKVYFDLGGEPDNDLPELVFWDGVHPYKLTIAEDFFHNGAAADAHDFKELFAGAATIHIAHIAGLPGTELRFCEDGREIRMTFADYPALINGKNGFCLTITAQAGASLEDFPSCPGLRMVLDSIAICMYE